MDFPWGWKDPRNTFLLPLWRDIFPEAKVIHVIRNGVDVAASLLTREEKRIRSTAPENDIFTEHIKRQMGSLRKGDLTSQLNLKIDRLLEMMTPLYKYRKYRVHRCIAIEYGFDLWTQYLERAYRWTASIPNQRVLHLKYEDFLFSPEEHFAKLQSFCNLNAPPQSIRTSLQGVNSSRSYAFLRQPHLVEFYNRIKNNFWMKKTGYSSIEF